MADAQTFVDKVLYQQDEHCCPPGGSTLTKKNGTRQQTLRALGGMRSVSIQQHWCFDCQHSDSEEVPDIAPHDGYTRWVQRKFHDRGIAPSLC